MSSAANVIIHCSQFPGQVRRDLLKSLRTRRVNHKFHYESIKQTHKWLALHEAFSPARNDRDCLRIYGQAFKAAAGQIPSRQIHVIGLGCGGGQKDVQLLKLLKSRGVKLFYTPSDVSVPMVLVARDAAAKIIGEENCFPFVCDLAEAIELGAELSSRNTQHATRLITFFGMIPNFEPQIILPKLSSLLNRGDWLLFSANLAPGENYDAGMKKILPQYDNPLTRDWLMTFLLDLGVERTDGDLRFTIENGASGLKRVMARFHFSKNRRVEVDGNTFQFRRGQPVQLFFSYRYTASRARQLLSRHRIEVVSSWTTRSEEEGVFLCRKK